MRGAPSATGPRLRRLLRSTPARCSLSTASTSAPLQNCFCFDVTRAAERASFPLPGGGKTGNPVKDAGMTLLGYHNWPMGYMARHYTTTVDARGELVVPTHADRPRGGVEVVA